MTVFRNIHRNKVYETQLNLLAMEKKTKQKTTPTKKDAFLSP